MYCVCVCDLVIVTWFKHVESHGSNMLRAMTAMAQPPEVEDPLLEPAPQRDHRSHGDEKPDGGRSGGELAHEFFVGQNEIVGSRSGYV